MNNNFENIINEKGFLVYSIVGTSMYPLLKEKSDSVHLIKINRKLKKNDVILYKRNNGQYVLHRLVKIKNGNYVFCGDNQCQKEYGIKDQNIIAIMEGYYKKEKYCSINSFKYKIYILTVKVKRPFKWIIFFVKKVLKTIIGRK